MSDGYSSNPVEPVESRQGGGRAGGSLVFALALVLLLAGCGGDETMDSEGGQSSSSDGSGPTSAESSAAEGSMMGEESAMDSGAPDLSQVEVGPDEEASMAPAQGIREAEAQPLPEDPPEGITVSDPTTNRTTDEPIEYDTSDGLPPTNGDHDTFWKNCGYYEEPVENRYAVHSLDHGAVWITYNPDLPADQIETLRRYGTEPYVLVSPFPDQSSPVAATSWRIQLPLESADDPRLDQFVEDFRVSEISPLSGNGCVGGNGEPLEAAPESFYREG